MAERVFQKIDNFNKGRRENTGYMQSVFLPLTDHIMHYGGIFPDNIYSPLSIQSLAVTFNDFGRTCFSVI